MSPTRALRRRPLRSAAALAGAAALALALSACSSGAKASGGSGTNFVGGSGKISRVAKGDRLAAPGLSGETVDGKQLNLADYKGKVVVLNVWGSWCPPCRAETPHLVKVANDTKSKGVEFVGINMRDPTRVNATGFETEFGVPYPSFYDPNGRLALKFPKGSLNPQGIPNTLILDRDGRIAVRILQAVGEDSLHEALDPIIAEK
ncbi:TlpA disulfide reductase family protein [Streptomyces sp. H10-C2]|uniref:TlpA family protein disulfide reductase n=1 Tax=unclassified Streptomyces TaxID=2593676 RepID=UPI0024BB3D86|nr:MULTISPECIES: TlpA disulfide reductase family protein [unclassified Streptomyces]MDJ0341946.1 TlpA disulfide reductase family protein [Streptomyces sp. PH10-H1]MDJ0369919.1 TlpA disulfide reductase family protein [Streptomyces sp. H10-C2]MDJ0370080.1 TlpA disulfide reductase family protein [Streptomyces sp. H10-C2]